jgi:hypothetical protein
MNTISGTKVINAIIVKSLKPMSDNLEILIIWHLRRVGPRSEV